MARILVIDDDPMMAQTLSEVVSDLGHEAFAVATRREGLRAASERNPDLVLLDVGLPDGSGLDILPDLLAVPGAPEVIIITASGDPDGAELAVKSGAWDYIEKPASLKRMTLPIVRALQYRSERTQARRPLVLDRSGIVGASPPLASSIQSMAQAAGSDANVLITGETGTGKELFATAIHRNSRRSRNSFVVVDCAALPENLVESLLFGHTRGAFTGAEREQTGLIAHAHGGTLFLDEVGELPLATQKSFLRVLQERRFRPVGSSREVASDFRIVAATNRDLEAQVRAGAFREDLLFRLRALHLHLPPLRERPADIRDLLLHRLTRLAECLGCETKGFSPEFLEALSLYPWPGNVRELLHAVDSTVHTAGPDPTLFPTHLPTHIRVHLARQSITSPCRPETSPSADPGTIQAVLPPLQKRREDAIAETERAYLRDLMEVTEGDIPEACRIAGLSRSRLYALLQRHHVSLPTA